jgi:uncharacterized protein YbaR (Trm112 family)
MGMKRGRTRRSTNAGAEVLRYVSKSAHDNDDMTDGCKPADLMKWAEDIACPVCFSPLVFSDAVVECSGCGRSYPVVDGIPVLIAERATLKTL